MLSLTKAAELAAREVARRRPRAVLSPWAPYEANWRSRYVSFYPGGERGAALMLAGHATAVGINTFLRFGCRRPKVSKCVVRVYGGVAVRATEHYEPSADRMVRQFTCMGYP